MPRVISADFLTPTHDKQSFHDNRFYRALCTKLGEALKVGVFTSMSISESMITAWP